MIEFGKSRIARLITVATLRDGRRSLSSNGTRNADHTFNVNILCECVCVCDEMKERERGGERNR